MSMALECKYFELSLNQTSKVSKIQQLQSHYRYPKVLSYKNVALVLEPFVYPIIQS